jgi:hypothetical protein
MGRGERAWSTESTRERARIGSSALLRSLPFVLAVPSQQRRMRERAQSFGETCAATTSPCGTVSADACAHLMKLLKQV